MSTAVEHGAVKRSHDGVWLMLLGVLALVLGVIGLYMTFALTIVSMIWFGALLFVVGIAHLAYAFRDRTARWQNALLGIVYIVAGGIMFAYPIGSAISLTLMIGFLLGVLGLARMIWSFWYPGFQNKLLGVLGGLISLVLGWMIIIGWPSTGLWVLGLFTAVDLIIYGCTMMAVGWRRR